MFEAEFRIVEPVDCFPSDAEPVEQRPGLDLLRENLKARGQMTPVLLAPHPSEPGKYHYIDGHGRGYCLAQLGRKMTALVVPGPLSDAELIEFKFSNNLIRRTMTVEEIGLESSRYIALTGCKQQEMADRLGVSDATISRSLAWLKRIPEGCEAMARQLGPSFVAVILTLKTPESRRIAFAHALNADADGRRPKRDELSRFVDELKGRKPAKPKRPKRFQVEFDGREFSIDLRPGDTPESLIEAFRALANQIGKHRAMKLETIASMFADRGTPPQTDIEPNHKPSIPYQEISA